MTYKIDRMDEISISVGASLDVNKNSFPVILGRYGLSDIGNRNNSEQSYLGDYQYNPSEQIGDIILCAGTYYGDGKVLVYGDTSSYQNSAISSTLPMIHSVFSWLGSSRTSNIELIQTTVSLVLLLIGVIFLVILRKNTIHFVFFPVVLCIALVISAVANPMILSKDEIQGNIVYIDTSHIERFNLEPYDDDSLTGLSLSLIRNDYLPIMCTDFSKGKISKSKILIFNAPTKMFSTDEVEFIKQYMNGGGLVILSTGYEDKDASMPLLNEFDLDIYDIPLGPIPYVEDDPEEYQKEPRFVDSWPIIIGDESVTETFYGIEIEGETYVLMTFTQYGDGGFLFISDSQYLLDKNIESLDDYWPGNIQFLKNIIDELLARGVL